MRKHMNHSAGRLEQTFPHQICVNLDRRPDRWRRMQVKFYRLGLKAVLRFPAVDGQKLAMPSSWKHTSGAYGCLLSHLSVVRQARQRGLPHVLIFEDDAVFARRFRERFATCVEQLPGDWDMLFFGALHKDEPIRISDNIGRITRANSTYAYVVRESVFDAFIELNSKAETVLDENSFILQRQFNCYCFIPNLVWVETDYSDAQNRFEHHWYLKESLILFGSQVDTLLKDTTIIFAHSARGESGRAGEILMYLANYYAEFFSPHIAIVIVEQGSNTTIDPACLPANCVYIFLENGSAFDKNRCFQVGIDNSDPARRFVILSDSDIYLETLDIRANLRMLERYDCITGFNNVIDLNEEDALRLSRTRTTRGLDISRGVADQRGANCWFLNRNAIKILGSERAGPPNISLNSLFLENKDCRVFKSPNQALRLR